MPLKKLPKAGFGFVASLAPLTTGLVGSGLLLAKRPLTAFFKVAKPEEGRGLTDLPLLGSLGTCSEALDAVLFRPRGVIAST
jgi:hypothetical protein